MKKLATLITGGAGFLGSFYCGKFIKNNHNVICVDNNEKKIKSLKRKYKKKFTSFVCDISNEQEVKKLFNHVNKNFFVNILVNNAAIDAIPSNFDKNTKYPEISQWDKEMNVGLKGAYIMIKYFGELMYKRNNGSIINIGSDLSVIAPNQKIYAGVYKNYFKPVTYSVLKHGLLGMTKYFASAYADKKVRVNMLSPGPVKNKQKKKLIDNLLDLIPAKRLANPEDIAETLLFLSGKKSQYINGQNILVDGGRTVI
jgi:NAD(P)-dependent dehydrogenase (short-subunit alcohol dehydrogenase family)